MTNAQRKAAQDAAAALKGKLTADKATIAKLREAAQLLASCALDLEMCMSNTVHAADKVIADPKAEQMRALGSSERHLDAFGRKRVRQARKHLTAALDAAHETLCTPVDVATPVATTENA